MTSPARTQKQGCQRADATARPSARPTRRPLSYSLACLFLGPEAPSPGHPVPCKMRFFSCLLLLVIPLLNLLTLAITHGDLLQRMICYCGTDDHRIDPLALACGKIDLN